MRLLTLWKQRTKFSVRESEAAHRCEPNSVVLTPLPFRMLRQSEDPRTRMRTRRSLPLHDTVVLQANLFFANADRLQNRPLTFQMIDLTKSNIQQSTKAKSNPNLPSTNPTQKLSTMFATRSTLLRAATRQARTKATLAGKPSAMPVSCSCRHSCSFHRAFDYQTSNNFESISFIASLCTAY